MRHNRFVFAVLAALLGLPGGPALSDPPLPPPAPPAPSQSPPPVPGAPAAAVPPASFLQQKSAQKEAQRLALHRQAQAMEREATRQAQARQFDRAQVLYGHAASLYHQQARQARQFALQMAKINQATLAARAHAEALSADSRYLACLASEVSVLKKSSLAETMPAQHAPPARPNTAMVVLPPPPAPVPPRAAKIKIPARPAALVPRHPQVAVRPLPAAKPRARTAARAQSAAQRLHAERVRKALPLLLAALRLAAVRPLDAAPDLIATQQHGLLQGRLRLRRALLQGGGEGGAPPSSCRAACPLTSNHRQTGAPAGGNFAAQIGFGGNDSGDLCV